MSHLWSEMATYKYHVISRSNTKILFSLDTEHSFSSRGYLGAIGEPASQTVLYVNETRPLP